jgi:hypothetical protein
MNLEHIFKEHPENLVPDVLVFRVVHHTQIVPIAYIPSKDQFCLRPHRFTEIPWMIKRAEVFTVSSFLQFEAPEDRSYHYKKLRDTFHPEAQCYAIKLAAHTTDSWNIRKIVGFVLFAQDLMVYR